MTTTRKLRVYAEAPEPQYCGGGDGVPLCVSTCGRLGKWRRGTMAHDCALSGVCWVGQPCIPTIREMAAELDELRAEVARKVEPLSDAERDEFETALEGVFPQGDEYLPPENVARVYKSLERVRGR